MHFFRSEEHIYKMDGFKKRHAEGIISIYDLMTFFSRPYFRNRRNKDYFIRMGEYAGDMIESLENLHNAGKFWQLKWFEKLAFATAIKLKII
jgi:hypothetical protein